MQFCSSGTVYDKCGGNEYNPSTHFCSGNTVVARCGGKEYNTTTQECTNNVVISYFTDTRDSKKYKTVDIGTQTWMAENLKYTPPNSAVAFAIDCPNKVTANCATFGRLYDWATAMELASAYNKNLFNTPGIKKKGVCPTGWHLPDTTEWNALVAYVGTNPGTQLKAASGWPSGANGTDNYGFTALPAGYVRDEVLDSPYGFGVSARWWTATEYNKNAEYAYNRGMTNDVGVYKVYGNESNTSAYDYSQIKYDQLSVRCVKD